MITKGKVLNDSQGRQFSDVVVDPQAPVQELFDLVNESGQRMSDFTVHGSLPALAAIVRELEQVDKVKKFFSTMPDQKTKRFKQFTGVVIRMKMEEKDCITSGSKGYVRKWVSRWYTKSEIYQPTPSHPEYPIWKSAQRQRVKAA